MEEDFLEATRGRDIQLFVVSDSEAILGIGDQGVGVRALSASKHAHILSLGCVCIGYRYHYRKISDIHVRPPVLTLCFAVHPSRRLLGGIDPSKTLSVVFDVGTDNETLLKDDLYVVCTAAHDIMNTPLKGF